MSHPSYVIHVGDCLQSLRAIPEQSVHCCVTSPPYFGLRDYGVDGQIGLEQTPDQYIAKLVEVFREVRRVLADDGTLWLNIGDSYAANGRSGLNTGWAERTKEYAGGGHRAEPSRHRGEKRVPDGLKQKDLIGIPWMLAFALRSDGWYLRQDIIWHKPNPMPESVRDRCTKAHEYIFLLSKSEKYYFDSEAIKEPAVGGLPGNKKHKHQQAYEAGDDRLRTKAGLTDYCARVAADPSLAETRNRRSVWTVATQPYKGAHFATFPPALIKPCILAGCPAGGVVLDPFGGSGTTAGVALAHGRSAVLCELNEEYAALVPDRVDSILAAYGKPTVKRKAAADPQMALLL